jgi:hypothetical protein
MEKNLRQRLQELEQLKGQVARRTRYMGSDQIDEPMYDVKKVDRMCADITKSLFKINQAVKESNASVRLEIDINYDKLLEPIE